MGFAVITGGSKGIGREMAFEFAHRGYDLLIIARNEGELQETALAIASKTGVKTHTLVADLSLSGAAEYICDWLNTHDVYPDVLVNNAGYGIWGRFYQLPLEQQTDLMQVNIRSLVELTYLLLPVLQKHSRSYILNVASTAAYQSVPTMAVYGASKAFVLNFTRALRYELRKTGVSVTCLSPGPTISNFTSRAGMQAMQAVADKFSMSSEKVAQIAVSGLFNGRVEIVPGFMNWVSVQATCFLPKLLIEKIAANLYEKHLK